MTLLEAREMVDTIQARVPGYAGITMRVTRGRTELVPALVFPHLTHLVASAPAGLGMNPGGGVVQARYSLRTLLLAAQCVARVRPDVETVIDVDQPAAEVLRSRWEQGHAVPATPGFMVVLVTLLCTGFRRICPMLIHFRPVTVLSPPWPEAAAWTRGAPGHPAFRLTCAFRGRQTSGGHR
ncbi:hypothetical protein ACFSC4_27750 [Deinococcus malanensis]|uniref:hypothetical protein n=1 Tax=Deinococcus malanensis TaxID=1706855 RepID=UPI00362C43F0